MREKIAGLSPQCRTDGQFWVNERQLVNIIEKCTQKDLDFNMDVTNHDDGNISVRVDQSDNSVNLSMRDIAGDDNDSEYSLWISKAEFIKFMKNCNNVLEYLNAEAE